MDKNTNRDAILNAIWGNPGPAFGCQFKQSGRYWENLKGGEYNERGKIRIAQVYNGPRINVYYNGGSHDYKTDVLTYIGENILHNGGDFYETLQGLAPLYGIDLQFTAEETKAIARQQLAREVGASLIQALRNNPEGEAAEYLRDTRKIDYTGDNAKYFGELTPESIKAAKQSLTNRGIKYNEQDFNALFLSAESIGKGHTAADVSTWGYRLVLPYYHNGQIVGFVLRNTNRDYKGTTKYLYSPGIGRRGWCDVLTPGEPAVFVEGQFDAIRLIQSGVNNVVALGGDQISDEIARLLVAKGITQVTYIPDREHGTDGQQDTRTIQKALTAFQAAKVDGEPVIKNLYVAELPRPEDLTTNPEYEKRKDGKLTGYKVDADTYGKLHQGGELAGVVAFAVASWQWEINNLFEWAKRNADEDGNINCSAFQFEFTKIYNRTTNPYERQRIKNEVTGGKYNEIFKAAGINAEALTNIDEQQRNTDYNNRLRALTDELNEAMGKGANPAVIAEILIKLGDLQSTNTRAEWEQQFNETFDDELAAIRNQPDTLKTKWELGNIGKDGKYYHYENIEYWPADIAVIAAESSHGKTAFMFQSVFDLLRQYPGKTFIYVSCEENKRQLLERALNVYLDIETTADGKASTGGYCFKRGTRRKTIKAVIKGSPAPLEYCGYDLESDHESQEHYKALTTRIRNGISKYGEEIRPRLKLVHTEGTAESIAGNLMYYVNQLRAEGVEIGGVFVDYMQLLTSDGKAYSRHDELKDICKALKGCAAYTELPMIIAAQMNREGLKNGIDSITLANLGEGADIERIAHDVYFVWQVDKTKTDLYTTGTDDGGRKWNGKQAGDRANRIFYKPDQLDTTKRELKRGYLYVEQMKARDGKTDGWGLFPFDGEHGRISENDQDAMKK